PDWLWAKRVGATGQDRGYATAVDASGNIYMTGTFQGTVDLDPGPGVFNLTATAGAGVDMFISKLDGSGNFVWAKQIAGWNLKEPRSIVLDNSGNIYTTGLFAGPVDFDPGPGVFNLTASGSSIDIFISKLDNNGNFVWAKQFTGALDDWGYSLAFDASG